MNLVLTGPLGPVWFRTFDDRFRTHRVAPRGRFGAARAARHAGDVDMKRMLLGAVAVAALLVAPATAGDVEFKPIDTKALVVKPSKVAAGLAASTINMVGQTAATGIEKDGFVKTINNVFGFRKEVSMPTQAGPSRIPVPSMYPQYQNAIKPVMPTSMPSRQR